MAIIFLQQKKTQKALLGIFILIVIVILIIIWQGSVKKEKSALVQNIAIISKKEIKIDFNRLTGQDLRNLVSFPEIEPFKEAASSTDETGKEIPETKIGRENPFLPY